MDWRSFVHDHAIVVLVAAIALSLLIAFVVMVYLPARQHLLRASFSIATWIAVALCCVLALSVLEVLPEPSVGTRQTVSIIFTAFLLIALLLMWRCGSWWAEHLQQERDQLSQKLKEAQSKMTLTLAQHGLPAEAKH